MRMVLAAMDSAKTLDTSGIIDALTNTSIDTVIGKLAVRNRRAAALWFREHRIAA